MKDDKRNEMMHDAFDEYLAASLPEEPDPSVSRRVTPWSDALTLILWSFGLGLINFSTSVFQPLLQITSIALGLLGWNRLRAENRSFRRGWVLMLIRSLLFTLQTFTDCTLWSLEEYLTAETRFFVILFFALLVLFQLICLRDGIGSVQKKAGTETNTGAVDLLIGAYLVMFFLAVFGVQGIIVLAVAVAVIAGLISAARLSHTLDEAGYAITPSPEKVSQRTLLCLFLGPLLLGSLICLLFFSRYPMKWQVQKEASASPFPETVGVPNVQPFSELGRKRLEELGLPEDILADLSQNDLSDCAKALTVRIRTSDYHTPNLDGLHLTCIAVALSGDSPVWKVFYHFSLPDSAHYPGTEALVLNPFSLFGMSAEITKEPHGQILAEWGGVTNAAAIPDISTDRSHHPGFIFTDEGQLNGKVSESIFASFSLPYRCRNARGYVCLTVKGPYLGIDHFLDDELFEMNYGSGLTYIHQTSFLQYPVRAAKYYAAPAAIGQNVFERIQLWQTSFLSES